MLRTMKRLTALSLGTRTPDDSQRTRLTCWVVERGGERRKEGGRARERSGRERGKGAADREEKGARSRATKKSRRPPSEMGLAGKNSHLGRSQKTAASGPSDRRTCFGGSKHRGRGPTTAECGARMEEERASVAAAAAADRRADALFLSIRSSPKRPPHRQQQQRRSFQRLS